MNGNQENATEMEVATFGAGCFWCVEAVFEKIEGVHSVVSGYKGGKTKNPTYEQVCRGDSGHAEVVRIEFDPGIVSYDRLLEIFWQAHDPTQLNRQGADIGTQYRSVIFYHSELQKEKAEASKSAADKSGKFKKPIVTQIVSAQEFYAAENYHQDYFRKNPHAPYSQHVIREKLKKLGLK
ncbi:MAG TPA: peptide-methionine (S)-S-oxide reductase MsrA [Kiritimatiellia bacterium]|nr:peptide-methionine (S)-S-oxide reductase MsrA [Kiritimatiellia bacterium]